MKTALDSLLMKLGNPGRYQILIFFLLAFNYFPITFNHIVMAFYGSTPSYTCMHNTYKMAAVENAKISDIYNNNRSVNEVDIGKCISTYKFEGGENMTVDCLRDPQGVLSFNKMMDGEESIVTEWGLVCDNAYLAKLATTIYFVGVMVGGLLFGYLADKFGRKPVMLVTLYMPIACGLGIAFVQHYILFVVLRFIQGIFMQGLQTTTYVLAMEMFLPQYRGIVGALLECYWGMAVLLMAPIAYLLQSWRYIQIAISVPSALAIGYIWLIPESLRWLATKNRSSQLDALVERISRFNKIDFPTEVMETVKLQMEVKEGLAVKQYTFLHLLYTPNIRKRTIILFYLWFSVAVGYYGLTFNVTSLPGNKYLNFFIAASVEMVAFIAVVFIIKRSKRRLCLFGFFLIGAFSLMTAGAVSFISRGDETMSKVSTGFAIFGKFGMGGVFSLTFLYTSELYPTVIRNIGMGSCAFWARLGGVVAPQVLMLGDFTHKSISVIVFGVIALIGGLVTLALPETLGMKLPDTLEDVESICSNIDGEDTAATKLTSVIKLPTDGAKPTRV